MIQIERTQMVSKDDLTPFAGLELASAESVLPPVSLLIWAVRADGVILAYVGLRQQTLVSQVEASLLLCVGAEQRIQSLLRVLRRLLLIARTARLFSCVFVRPEHERFTRLVGFQRDREIQGWIRMVV